MLIAVISGKYNLRESISRLVFSLIASAKELIKFRGECKLIELFNAWCEESEKWTKFSETPIEGRVTGIINSNGKTGIFVELNDLYITGLMPIDSTELLDYRPGDQIKVSIAEFEVQEGKEPFVLNKNNKVTFANTRCVFELA